MPVLTIKKSGIACTAIAMIATEFMIILIKG